MPTISYTGNLDDPAYARTKAESAEELLRFVRGCRVWIDAHLKDHNSAMADETLRYLRKMEDIAKREPVESQAALCGASAVWNMLFADANRGSRVRHINEVIEDQKYIDLLDRFRREYLDEKRITVLREKIAKELGCSIKSVKNHTRINGVLYNPIK